MTIPTGIPENQAQTAESRPNDLGQNIAQMRRQLEQERAARQQAEERAARAEESAKRSLSDNDDDYPSDEPYVDHRSLDKKLKKTLPQFKEDVKKELREEMRMEFEQQKKTSYLKQKSDFDQVMTPDMMQKLVQRDPELAETILEMPDGFARQKLVYHAIKAIGLDRKEEAKPTVQQTIEANKRSPYYQPSGVSTAPYAQVGDFSPAGQKNAHAKMQELKNKLRL